MRPPQPQLLLLLAQLQYKGVVGSGCDGCRLLSLVRFCLELLFCTGREIQDQRLGEDFQRQIPLDKLKIRTHKLFVSTPRLEPTEGTNNEVKSTLQLQL